RAAHAGTGAVELGNMDLGAERGRSIEALARLGSGAWSGELAVYENVIDDYVHLVAVGDTVIGGVELPVVAYAPTKARLRGVEGRLSHAVTRRFVLGGIGDFVRGEEADGTPLSYMPPARLGVTLRWESE